MELKLNATLKSSFYKRVMLPFWMSKYEVTQGQWKKIMGNNTSSFDRGDNHPVETVSWNDCQDFIDKLNSESSKTFSLPTEAEWEYASRSGGKEQEFAGGDDIDSLAWYAENSDGHTHEVGTKDPNDLGIYDMSGNVLEWCSDWYSSDYYSNSPKDNPQGPSSGSYRVLRGGSWSEGSKFDWDIATTSRYRYEPSNTSKEYGLRLVWRDSKQNFQSYYKLTFFPEGISSSDCSKIGDEIYIFGGKKESNQEENVGTKDIYKFVISEKKLVKTDHQLPYGMLWGISASTAKDDHIYLGPAGGPERNNGWGTHKKIVDYNPNTGNAVETSAGYSNDMWGVTTVTGPNGYVYLIGGHDGTDQDTIYKYDHTADNKELVANLPNRVSKPYAILASDDNIYIHNHDSGQISRFDPVNQNIEKVAETSDKYNLGGSNLIWQDTQDNIYFILRDNENNELKGFKFNISTNQVQEMDTEIPNLLNNSCCAQDGENVYFFGGRDLDTGDFSNSVYQFKISDY